MFSDFDENSCITGFDTPATGAYGNEGGLAETNQNGDSVPEASPTNIEDIVGDRDGATGDQIFGINETQSRYYYGWMDGLRNWRTFAKRNADKVMR